MYPNYRVSVEAVIRKGKCVLLCKRAEDAKIAPGVWNVPAGKVKYTEIPQNAVIREVKEETLLDVTNSEEINVRAFESSSSSEQEKIYRLVYTYLIELDSNSEPVINEEHSEYTWVSKDEINDKKFNNMDKSLKDIIINKAFKS